MAEYAIVSIFYVLINRFHSQKNYLLQIVSALNCMV